MNACSVAGAAIVGSFVKCPADWLTDEFQILLFRIGTLQYNLFAVEVELLLPPLGSPELPSQGLESPQNSLSLLQAGGSAPLTHSSPSVQPLCLIAGASVGNRPSCIPTSIPTCDGQHTCCVLPNAPALPLLLQSHLPSSGSTSQSPYLYTGAVCTLH